MSQGFKGADLRFPPDFWWGASTAGYQIEGDNTGSDLWDWERRRGWELSLKCANSWELWKEDHRCLRELGANTYRLGLEWGRLAPAPGVVDESVLRRYETQLQALRADGVRPIVCLHHFTHPKWFRERFPEGWADPGAVDEFAAHAGRLAEALGGLVDDWLPFNEPMMPLFHGEVTGYFPPGRRSLLQGTLNPPRLRAALKGMALAHRRAAEAIRGADKFDADGDGRAARIGIAHNIAHIEPYSDSASDKRAAVQWDQFFHWNFLDAAVHGTMDLDLDGEPETNLGRGSTLDWVGINYYTRTFVRGAPLRHGMQGVPLYLEAGLQMGALRGLMEWLSWKRADRPRDDMNRELYPEGLEQVVRAVHARYKLPVLVTENGVADARDRMRELYVWSHLSALAAAAKDVPVLGYLYWSLVDNYEWGTFAPRFGLFRVEYEEGFRRVPTRGAAMFAEIVRRSQAAARKA